MTFSLTHSNNQDLPVQVRNNPILGATIPFATRAIVELWAWRDLKYFDGSLNIGHRVIASVASGMIAVLALVENVVRGFFSIILLPFSFNTWMSDKGQELYVAYNSGTYLIWGQCFLQQ